MSGYEPHFDVNGNPVIYDVSAYETREGLVGAPVGTWLTKSNGRRFKVTADFPLDPVYVAERDLLIKQRERAESARAKRAAQRSTPHGETMPA